ncbi:unnamed protein product [Allacma fusca]|uniref:Spt5 transcription elongation factor N-terminal domain-containing protein n=1 Tax=Allacma fusca TaxID=39272 RepID=A0A8J2J425_9HEXA|nr:unnamed protein product [Allacma fusca]
MSDSEGSEGVEDEQEPEGEDITNKSEDEYDEEEEEDDEFRPRKKHRGGGGGFILEEAEVDDDIEDEEEWEDGAENYNLQDLEEHGPTARDIDAHSRRQTIWDSQKEEELEKYLKQKYADEAVAARHFGDGGEDMSDEITQQTLLPGIKLGKYRFVIFIMW